MEGATAAEPGAKLDPDEHVTDPHEQGTDPDPQQLAAAKDGDEAAQLSLGKFYLDQGQTKEARSKLCEQGVYWLIQASRKGNEEATKELQDCLDRRLGITEENISDVTWCINTPQVEKNIRNAAQAVFAKINPLGNSISSPKELEEKLADLGLDPETWAILKNTAKFKGDKGLSEDDFVNKMVKRTLFGFKGLGTLLQSDVEMETYNNSTWYTKVTRYPVQTAQIQLDRLLEMVGEKGMGWLQSMIPSTQLYVLVALWIYSMMTLDLMSWLLPLLLFFPAVGVLLTATLQMFYNKRKLDGVQRTANMLQKFNETLNPDTVASTFQLKSLTPYISFFCCLPLTVLLFSLADLKWIPTSELTCISLLMTVICFQGLSDHHDKLALLSILLDLFSCLPLLLPSWVDDSSVLSFLFGHGFELEISAFANMYLSLPSIAYLAVYAILALMAVRAGSFKGAVQILVPHMVCFLWWEITTLFMRQATLVGLLRGTFGWLMLIVIAPLLLVFLLIWMGIGIIKMTTFGSLLKVVTTLLVLSLPVALGFWAKSGFKVRSFSLTQKTRTVRAVLAVLGVLSSIPILVYLLPSKDIETVKRIEWHDYRTACGAPSWQKTNLAVTSALCQHLEGTVVDWQATVKQVVITESTNQGEQLLSWLPNILSDWLRCTYGQPYPVEENTSGSPESWVYQTARLQLKRSCHLKRFSRYSFLLTVSMTAADGGVQDINLIASMSFKNALLALRAGDQIKFRATLTSGLGTPGTKLMLHMLECLSCKEKIAYGHKQAVSEAWWEVVSMLQRGAMEVGNFYLSPLLELEEDDDEDGDMD